MERVRILIADDNSAVRAQLGQAIAAQADLELAGEAATDYIRVVGITSEIEEAEERLLEIYSELDAAQAAAGRTTD